MPASGRETASSPTPGVHCLPAPAGGTGASAGYDGCTCHPPVSERCSTSQAQLLTFASLDLREAFYRVIRPLITGGRFNDESFAQVAATLRLRPDTLAVLHRHMQDASLPLAGASQWASFSLSEILDCTWFRFRRGPQVAETGVGSRPGDNCADLVFSYLFACVLRDLREELGEKGVLTRLPWAVWKSFLQTKGLSLCFLFWTRPGWMISL